jgi:hypothetical protein
MACEEVAAIHAPLSTITSLDRERNNQPPSNRGSQRHNGNRRRPGDQPGAEPVFQERQRADACDAGGNRRREACLDDAKNIWSRLARRGVLPGPKYQSSTSTAAA